MKRSEKLENQIENLHKKLINVNDMQTFENPELETLKGLFIDL